MRLLKFKSVTVSSNSKVVISGVFGTVVVKGASLAISLCTMPIYLNYFSANQVLGLWFTVLAVLSWLLNFDYGIGNGLRNKLVTYYVRDDKESIRKGISSSYIYVTIISGIMLIIFIASNRFINWNNIFNISNTVVSSRELEYTVIILICSILLQMILRLVTSILYALQLSYVPNILNLITNIILIIGIKLLIQFNITDNILVLSWLYLLSVNIPLVATTIILFKGRLKDYRPRFVDFDKKVGNQILRFGLAFLWLSIMSMLIQSTNEILISKLVSSEEVVTYSIYQKIFLTASTLFTLALTPIWSIVTKANEERNYEWIFKLFKLLIGGSVLAFIVLSLLSLKFQLVIDLWLQSSRIVIEIKYAFIFAILSFLNILAGILTTLSNGMGLLRVEIVLLTSGAVLNIPLSILLSGVYNSFIAIVIANVISLLPLSIIQTIYLYKYMYRKVNLQG